MVDKGLMSVEVAYAKPDAQALVTISVPVGATVAQAIALAGILERFPEIDLAVNTVGIYSQSCGVEQVLQAGDRVEIYRSLLHDPKEARRHRASKR